MSYYQPSSTLAVPSHIKCNRCGIVKNATSYSNKQRGDLAAHVASTPRFNAATTAYIACMSCTPQQVVELHCYRCDKDKGLDKFSKSQRRTPDHAICWVCAEERDNYEPGAEEGDDSSPAGSSDDDDDDDDDSDEEDFKLPASPTGTASLGGTARGTYSSRGGVSLLSSGGSTSAGTSAAGSSRAPTSALRSTTNSSVVGSSSGGKFAKVKAAPRKVVYDKALEERNQARDDDSDRYEISDSD